MKLGAKILVCTLMTAPLARSSIWVPAQGPTIQAAINSAGDGDTIIVADGTYSGPGNRDIDFDGKNIVLMSENGPEYTIIDCDGTEADPHRAFYLKSGEDTTAVIEGFTITDAYAADLHGNPWFDAAVLAESASPTLRNCIVTANDCHGVRYSDATLHMYDCLVADNRGSGIVSDGCETTIINCEASFNDNYGVLWLAQWYGREFEMLSCLVRGNGWTGLNLFIGMGLFHVQNCTFVENLTGLNYEWNFPKLAVTGQSTAVVDVSTIEDCIMAYNSEYGLVAHVWAGEVIVRCNDAYGNGIEDYHEVGVGPDDDYDNISADPLFCDQAVGNYHLSGNSPCAPENNSCGTLMGAFGVGCAPTGVDDDNPAAVPESYVLGQNWPNPFNPSTDIPFELPTAAHVKLEILNLLGQPVATLIDRPMEAGFHTARWEATGQPSGVYFYRIRSDSFCSCRKMVLLK
ncbi:MAG: right-handed parallel beta-helix repeat-containing protein [Candidatus Zixiibacteriota bacterium]|nr:MAG: right-handed parallel beta-helix repeat-containing protein [candidate division Zixibacteria bacterium]